MKTTINKKFSNFLLHWFKNCKIKNVHTTSQRPSWRCQKESKWPCDLWGLQGHIHGLYLIILYARRTGNNPQEGFVKFG